VKAILTDDKLRGGYYTPGAIARFLAEWAIRTPSDAVLEPSCGDGAILSATTARLRALGCPEPEIAARACGVELLPEEARKAARTGACIETGDFFAFFRDRLADAPARFDAVVGNPPFIRYQNFPEASREVAFSLLRERGLHPNRLTNAWMPFLVLAAHALRDGGRLAMVIPAELLQVDYAGETRRFLASFFCRVSVVLFRNLVFDGIQQEVVLVLAEKDAPESGIRVVEFAGAGELERDGMRILDAAAAIPCARDTGKWTRFFLSAGENALLDRLALDDRIARATDLFEVNVGLVSGENDFFVLSHGDVEREGIGAFVRPLVSRAEQVRGTVLSQADMDALVAAGKRVFLFALGNVPKDTLPAAARAYVELGEAKKFNANYKCSIREHWHHVPESWIAHAFLTRQVNGNPRMVLNPTGALVTDTLHKIRFHVPSDGPKIVSAFLNSYTFALSEILGRSYGGGVMTFEPGEVRRMRIPVVGAERLDQGRIDELVRAGRIDDVLNETDRILLREGLGLSAEETDAIRGIWKKLRDRRLARKRRSDAPSENPNAERGERIRFDSEDETGQMLLAMEPPPDLGAFRLRPRRNPCKRPRRGTSSGS